MPTIENLKGFRDFLPEEMAARREVFDRIEQVVQRYGFREIDLPALESLDLYRVKSGDELLDQTYSFEDKGDRHVTMTPEQTPSRARILANNKSLSKPVKWYCASKRWRYEAPQRGRTREFYQVDIDIFGAESVQADAEILAVAADIFDELDVLHTVDILINDRRVLESVLEAHGIEKTEPVLEIIDDKEKMTTDEFVKELQESGLSRDQAQNVDELTAISGPITDVIDDVASITTDDEVVNDAVGRLRDLASELENHSVAQTVKLNLSIVRGLAYYTGLVFEVFDTEGELRALCGGGRYDDLIDLFGGESTAAVGFAPGDAPIEEIMKREDVWPAEELATDVYVLPVSERVRDEASSIVGSLRDEGCVVETDLQGRNVGNQLGYAETIGSELTIIIGERDLEQDNITIKDMESGDEEQVPLDDAVDTIVTRLNQD